MFGKPLPDKLLSLPIKGFIYIIPLNKKINLLKCMFTSILKAKK